MKKNRFNAKQLSNLMSYVIACILVLLPFHAFLTTWAGSNFGSLDWFRIWKEIVIFLLLFGVLWLIKVDKTLRKNVMFSFIVQLVLLYIVFSLLRGWNGYVSGAVNREALLYGVIINLRYFVFFIVVWVVVQKSQYLYKNWLKLLLGPAVLVVLFGLMQQFVLEKDFLRHFGYGESTIPAFQGVDNKAEYARVQSTLRGANPLGAYLILIISTLTGLFLKHKERVVIWLALVASTTALLFTYSRSAWLGLVVSAVVLVLLSTISQKSRLILLSISLVCVVGFASSIYVLRDNDFIQNTVFHSDENSLAATSSNEVRYGALSNGLGDVIKEPLGRGVGSAGPASTRNNAPARIAENYYIQLAQEIGVIGLLLYISISFMVVKELWWRHKKELLARVLLASFAGITVINFVSHAWTDDTLSLLWWGLAGIAIAQPVILKSKSHGKKA